LYITPFNISDVADVLSITRLEDKEDEFDVVCPFCGDRRGKMNFCIYKDGELRNTYHCYNCGQGGNMLTLYAELKGIQGEDCYKKAYHAIKRSLNLTDQKVSEQRKILKRTQQKKKKQSVMPVDFKNRDIVYRKMIELLHLSFSHKKALQERGLDERMISQMEQKGYKSTDYRESETIARRLIKQGLNLEGVPGFFVNQRGDWEAAFYRSNAGFLCPVWSENHLLIAFQIRLDYPYKKRKYVWFTSTGKNKGCSSGSPVGISGSSNVRRICLTEGILKGEIAYQFTGETYLGNPGVGNHMELGKMLQRLKDRGLEEVYEFYDMDKNMDLICYGDYDKTCQFCALKEDKNNVSECPKKREKRDCIRKGCNRLYQICEELSLYCVRKVWDQSSDGVWLENFKGVDDLEANIYQNKYISIEIA